MPANLALSAGSGSQSSSPQPNTGRASLLELIPQELGRSSFRHHLELNRKEKRRHLLKACKILTALYKRLRTVISLFIRSLKFRGKYFPPEKFRCGVTAFFQLIFSIEFYAFYKSLDAKSAGTHRVFIRRKKWKRNQGKSSQLALPSRATSLRRLLLTTRVRVPVLNRVTQWREIFPFVGWRVETKILTNENKNYGVNKLGKWSVLAVKRK